jgi:ubiquitin-activating enzyme E1
MSYKEKRNSFGFDIDLYSRQLGISDIETLNKFIKIDILLIDLRGLGAEVYKKFNLEGFNSVDIYYPNYININDLNSNFFINEKDISKIKDETIFERIKNVQSKI